MQHQQLNTETQSPREHQKKISKLLESSRKNTHLCRCGRYHENTFCRGSKLGETLLLRIPEGQRTGGCGTSAHQICPEVSGELFLDRTYLACGAWVAWGLPERLEDIPRGRSCASVFLFRRHRVLGLRRRRQFVVYVRDPLVKVFVKVRSQKSLEKIIDWINI